MDYGIARRYKSISSLCSYCKREFHPHLGRPNERFCRLDRFTTPKRSVAAVPTNGAGSGRLALAAKPTTQTKQQEFDAYLNYDVTIGRWRFELMRLGAWFIGFQLSFFFLLVLPLVVLRAVTGADSPFVP